jgi:type VI secretion system protein VasG
MKTIVALKLSKIAGRLKKIHTIDFDYAPELIESIFQKCSTSETGARNIDVVIDQTLLPTISQALLAQMGSNDEPYAKVKVSYSDEENFAITFE